MSEILIGRCGRTQEGQIRINKKSDFPLTLKLMKDGNFIKWYDCDFDIRAFVEDGFTTYTAGRNEGVFNHCRVEEDGTLTLFFDNHNLPIGELQIEVIFHHPDSNYGTDGVRQEAFTVASNICLVNDNGNAISLSIPEPKVVEKEVEKVVEVEVSRKENINVFNVLGFDGFVESASNLEAETATANYTILFDKQNKRFVALHDGNYSANWHIEDLDRTDEIYQTQGENVQPYANKIYIDKTDGIMYYWNGNNLSPLKVKPKDNEEDFTNEITKIKERLTTLESGKENGATHFTEELNEAKKNLETLITSKNEETKRLVTALQERINTLVGSNASEAIDSFNEVIKFLGGVKDNDTLNALLAKINERLNTLETTKVTTLENSVNSLRGELASETSNRVQGVSGLDSKLTALQGKVTEETSTRETAVREITNRLDTEVSNRTQALSGVNGTIETLRNSITTEASARENAVNVLNSTIERVSASITKEMQNRENADNGIRNSLDELKGFVDKKRISERAETITNGDVRELTLQAGKVYVLYEYVENLRIKAIAPPENANEVAEATLYFHTGTYDSSGIVTRSGSNVPMIRFEGVILPENITIEKNVFYEVSFKYNPIARKYTALVASWAIA